MCSRRPSSAERSASLQRSLSVDFLATGSMSRCPPIRCRPLGLHLIMQTMREIEAVLIGLGFSIIEGPEVETVYFNFDTLNTPLDPSLAADDRPSTSNQQATSSIRTRCCFGPIPRRCRSERWSSSNRRSTFIVRAERIALI